MAELNSFDPTQHEEMGNYEPLPAGWYDSVIIESEVADTKSGGRMLKLQYEVITGEHKGRKFFNNLNIENASKKAESIAMKELTTICNKVGWAKKLTDSEVLHDKPMKVKLTIRKSEEYGDQNTVKGYDFFETATKATKKGEKEDRPW